MSSNLGLEGIYDKTNQAVKDAEQAVTDSINAISGEGADDPAAIAKLQQAINTWSVIISAQSNVVKSIKDSMSGILQRIN